MHNYRGYRRGGAVHNRGGQHIQGRGLTTTEGGGGDIQQRGGGGHTTRDAQTAAVAPAPGIFETPDLPRSSLVTSDVYATHPDWH